MQEEIVLGCSISARLLENLLFRNICDMRLCTTGRDWRRVVVRNYMWLILFTVQNANTIRTILTEYEYC